MAFFDNIKDSIRTLGQNLGIVPLVSPIPKMEYRGNGEYSDAPRLANNPTPLPTPTAIPTPAPALYSPNITIPGKYGDSYRLPAEKAQVLLNSFNDIGEATNAARVMIHPRENTTTLDEIKRGLKNNFNYGENPELDMTAGTKRNTSDGTYDTGALRMNSGTFNEMQNSNYWNSRMRAKGITNYNELQSNPQKNADMARLRLEYGNWISSVKNPETDVVTPGHISDNPNWRHWYAAPMDLRTK